MKTNVKEKKEPVLTHGGAVSSPTNPAQKLERLVAACMLNESTFYETASDNTKAIEAACETSSADEIAILARRARRDFKLRHVPLFLLVQLTKKQKSGGLPKGFSLADTITDVIQRPDELGEFLSLWMKYTGAKSPKKMSHAMRRGLAGAFKKFDAYQLGKWTKESQSISPRDIMFLCHPKPDTEEQTKTWKALADKSLASPDTWEVALSAGKDKKETWERLLTTGKLGDMALLMNLRGMTNVGVQRAVIRAAIEKAKFSRILPFRFLSAAKHAPGYEDVLGNAISRGCQTLGKLKGTTLVVVDTSGSMHSPVSIRSEISRLETALGMAMFLVEICEDVVIYATAGNDYTRIHATEKVPTRKTFALVDAVNAVTPSIGGGGIFLTQAIDFIASKESTTNFERVVVITDEQDCDTDLNRKPANAKTLGKKNYILNIGTYEHGIGSQGNWNLINGFSERCLDWISYDETGVVL